MVEENLIDDYRNSRKRWSGSGEDLARDPWVLKNIMSNVATKHQWKSQLKKGELLARIPEILGADLQQKIISVSLTGTTLILEAISTAWVTQLRFMTNQIVEKVNQSQEFHVDQIKVFGPKPPSWRYGSRHVSGKGPRDTYG